MRPTKGEQVTTRNDEINEFIDKVLEDSSIPDIPEHRLAALKGLQEAWREDTDVCWEKSMYQMSLTTEILRMEMKIMFKSWRFER